MCFIRCYERKAGSPSNDDGQYQDKHKNRLAPGIKQQARRQQDTISESSCSKPRIIIEQQHCREKRKKETKKPLMKKP